MDWDQTGFIDRAGRRPSVGVCGFNWGACAKQLWGKNVIVLHAVGFNDV